MQPSDDVVFARQMQQLREALGWSQGELARRMVEAGFPNYSQMTVSRTEKAARPIRLSEARVIAQILGSSVDEMLRTEQDADAVHRTLLDARSALIDAQEELTKARASWVKATATAQGALRVAERPRDGGDPRTEGYIDVLVGDIERLIRYSPEDRARAEAARDRAAAEGRGVVAASIDAALRELDDPRA